MPRETRIIETKLGNKIEILSYFTQNERSKAQRVLAGDNTGGQEAKQTSLLDSTALAVQMALVSLNGETEGIFEKLTGEMPTSEYDEVLNVVVEYIKQDLQIAK